MKGLVYSTFRMVLWAVLSAAGGSPGEIAAQSKPFQTDVTIWTLKNHYYTREPVWIYVRIENRDPAGPKIAIPLIERCLVITDDEGNRFSTNPEPPGNRYDRPMTNGEILEYKTNILKFFFRLGKRDPYLIPGRYRVAFHYEESGHRPLTSKQIPFSVTDPEDEEAEPFYLLNEGDTQFRLKKLEKSDACYRQLITKYPNSIYAPNALELIFKNHYRRSGRNHQEIALETGKRLIRNYPVNTFNLQLVFYELESLHQARNDRSGWKAFLDSLRTESASLHIRQLAEKRLERLKMVHD